MKKTISVILILFVLFCSFMGLNYLNFLKFTSKVGSKVNSISEYVYDKVSSIFIDPDILVIPGGSVDSSVDSPGYVQSDHMECYLKYIRDAGHEDIIEDYFNKELLSQIFVFSPIYTCKIKTSGAWYNATVIMFNSAFDNDGGHNHCVIVNCDYTDFIGQCFFKTWVIGFGDVGNFHGFFDMRDISDFTTDYISTLADISHNCVVTN